MVTKHSPTVVVLTIKLPTGGVYGAVKLEKVAAPSVNLNALTKVLVPVDKTVGQLS